MKRFLFLLLAVVMLTVSITRADTIRWVDFNIAVDSLELAMQTDIQTANKEHHISWIDILSVAACRTGGKCPVSSVKKAIRELEAGKSPEEILGSTYRYFAYYHAAYTAVLGGMLGHYAIIINGEEKQEYGLKAYSPIASGYGYSHCDDFGVSRSFGFRRKHLGHDLMGGLGTPVVAVEGGVVEAMGWNRYGGWRIGIRSFDSKRYYYYAHLQKDRPFAENLAVGDLVQPGDVIGYMGRTGYSDRENVNNIETVHLHFGMQLIFEESQKECNSEIWINVYPIVQLLERHRSTVVRTEKGFVRKYAFRDLDANEFP